MKEYDVCIIEVFNSLEKANFKLKELTEKEKQVYTKNWGDFEEWYSDNASEISYPDKSVYSSYIIIEKDVK